MFVAQLIYAATRPNEARTARSTRINASPEKITPFLVDLHQWASWSPWEQLDLRFIKPFQAHCLAIFTLEPGGDSTNVTWAMEGPRPFMVKLMGVFMNMDKMVGHDFEAGLANLKSIAEK
ncbi:MAG TPA: SRPBCC family protein [Gemmatimonadaceae bacterium]